MSRHGEGDRRPRGVGTSGPPVRRQFAHRSSCNSAALLGRLPAQAWSGKCPAPSLDEQADIDLPTGGPPVPTRNPFPRCPSFSFPYSFSFALSETAGSVEGERERERRTRTMAVGQCASPTFMTVSNPKNGSWSSFDESKPPTRRIFCDDCPVLELTFLSCLQLPFLGLVKFPKVGQGLRPASGRRVGDLALLIYALLPHEVNEYPT